MNLKKKGRLIDEFKKKGWLIDGFENRFVNFQTFVLNLGRFLKIFGKSKKKRVEFLKI